MLNTFLQNQTKKKILTILSFIGLFALTLSLHTFAAPQYNAGETLDPTCAPGDTDCTVTPLDTGDTIPGATAGSIFFAGTAGVLSQDNSNLFFDDTNNRLGVGRASPNETLHIDGFIRTEESSAPVQTDFDGYTVDVQQFQEFNGKLYVGLGDDSGENDIWMYDGDTWTQSYDGSVNYIYKMVSWGGKLYAGVGSTSAGGGDIIVCNPVSTGDSDTCQSGDWSVFYDGAQEEINGLAIYNNQLYFGQGNSVGDGDIYACSSAGSCTLSYDGSSGRFGVFAVYNGKLYAGQGRDGSTEANVYVFDGTDWTLSYSSTKPNTLSMAVYQGKLYAGFGGSGPIAVFDGSAWSTSFSGNGYVQVLTVYNGKLYAGLGSGGKTYILDGDGGSWRQIFTTPGATEQEALGVYNGKLYIGYSDVGTGHGDIYVYNERLESQLSKGWFNSGVSSFNEEYQHFTRDISIGGSLGIGDTTPSYTLDVNGKIGINDTQIIYLPDQTDHEGSLIIGNGGASINSNAIYNTAIGINAFFANTSGYSNLAIGYNSLDSNTAGYENTAIGHEALSSNTGDSSNGYQNTAIGPYALYSNIGANIGIGNANGYGNTAIGPYALYSNLGTNDGYNNIAIGPEALYSNVGEVDGYENIGIGYRSLYGNTEGYANIVIGHLSGENITTGDRNIIIGYQIDAVSATGDNQLNIGNTIYGDLSTDAIGIGSSTISAKLHVTGTTEQLRLGYNASNYWSATVGTTGALTLAGTGAGGSLAFTPTSGQNITVTLGGTAAFVYAGDYSANYTVRSLTDKAYVDAGDASDPRLKTITGDLENTLGFVMNTNPVRFIWNDGVHSTLQGNDLGFTTDQFETVFPELLRHDFMVGEETYNRLLYERLTPILWRATQELNLTIVGIQDITDATFIDKLVQWFGNIENGIGEFVAGRVRARNELCVGNTCISEAQFLQMINQSNTEYTTIETEEETTENAVEEIIAEEEVVIEEVPVENTEQVTEEFTEIIPEETLTEEIVTEEVVVEETIN